MDTARTETVSELTDPHPGSPVDPRAQPRPSVLLAVALGGGLGAAARHAASVLWPMTPGQFPWTTLLINVLGCATIGVLMAVPTRGRWTPRLLRPFVGTGLLGGFTTFSTYALDIHHLLQAGQAATALAYLASTLLAALAAVWTTATTTRALARRRHR